jgi:hypothetical protein
MLAPESVPVQNVLFAKALAGTIGCSGHGSEALAEPQGVRPSEKALFRSAKASDMAVCSTTW